MFGPVVHVTSLAFCDNSVGASSLSAARSIIINMSAGHSSLRNLLWSITRLRRRKATDLSKIHIPYPPLLESVPPMGFRYAIPIVISFGAFMYVRIVFVRGSAVGLMSKHLQNRGFRHGLELLGTNKRTLARESSGTSVTEGLHFNQSHP